jgi:hypothetical protein
MVGMPYFWLFEAISPVIEVTGYLMLPLVFLLGIVNPGFAGLFLLLAVMYGILLSEMAVGVETMLLSRYPRVRDRMALFAAAILEFAGYHQILAVERFVAAFQIRRRRGIWGQMRRTGAAQSAPAPAGWPPVVRSAPRDLPAPDGAPADRRSQR